MMLEQLELQAHELEKKSHDPDATDAVTEAYRESAERIRAVLVEHLGPGTGVRYYYASTWHTGVLLIRPKEPHGCFQVRRDGHGGWVDHVERNPCLIRVALQGPGNSGVSSGEDQEP